MNSDFKSKIFSDSAILEMFIKFSSTLDSSLPEKFKEHLRKAEDRFYVCSSCKAYTLKEEKCDYCLGDW